MEKKCRFVMPKGEACKMRPLRDSNYCRSHDPESAEARRQASAKGGRARRELAVLSPDTAPLILRTAEDVGKLMVTTINQVRVGEIDVKVANTIGFLAGIWLRTMELGQIADRLEALEVRD